MPKVDDSDYPHRPLLPLQSLPWVSRLLLILLPTLPTLKCTSQKTSEYLGASSYLQAPPVQR